MPAHSRRKLAAAAGTRTEAERPSCSPQDYADIRDLCINSRKSASECASALAAIASGLGRQSPADSRHRAAQVPRRSASVDGCDRSNTESFVSGGVAGARSLARRNGTDLETGAGGWWEVPGHESRSSAQSRLQEGAQVGERDGRESFPGTYRCGRGSKKQGLDIKMLGKFDSRFAKGLDIRLQAPGVEDSRGIRSVRTTMVRAPEVKMEKRSQEDQSCSETEGGGASSMTYFPPVRGVRGGKGSEEGKGGKSLGASASSHADWILSMR